MSYNQTIFNTPTIYIDIQADFDRTMDVLIMVGQVNKISKFEKIKRETEQINEIIKRALYNRQKELYEMDNIYENMLDWANIKIKANKNIPIRTPSGKFSSTHKEIARIIQEGFDSDRYSVVNGLFPRMNKQQKLDYYKAVNQFVSSLVRIDGYTEEIKWAEQRYRKASEVYVKSSKQLEKAENKLEASKVKLKKLGFVAIIKMMNDIEKKARRYTL